MPRPAVIALLAAGAVATPALAGPGTVDLHVSTILTTGNWTSATPVDGYRAYSAGYALCNSGDLASFWQPNTPMHPVSTSNLFVLRDGMILQIGMSWVFHEFFPLQQHCSFCTAGPTGSLGTGCQTQITANTTGSQSQLRRRSEVNPWTGAFPMPGDTSGDTSLIGQRIQVHTDDLPPSEGDYFIEVQVVSSDEVADDAKRFNSSYRHVLIGGPNQTMTAEGPTVESAAIFTWQNYGANGSFDPSVRIETIHVPDDGVAHVASKARNIGGGVWRYTYAVQNMNVDRAFDWFSVLMGADGDPDNVLFHDVDYHSGEVYDNTDWTILEGDATIFWHSPQTFAENPNTNALRWGTMYTFQFDAAALPHDGSVGLGLFKPGTPDAISAPATVPSQIYCPTDIDGDTLTSFADLNLILGSYGAEGPELAPDIDGDGEVGFSDLNLLLGQYGQGC